MHSRGDFSGITATDAATWDEDASALQTQELSSQVDDLDGDRKGDELAFQIDLSPRQTPIVTISYGEGSASGACHETAVC